jgi:hypothetical protein
MAQKAAKISMILHKIKVGLYQRFNLFRNFFHPLTASLISAYILSSFSVMILT